LLMKYACFKLSVLNSKLSIRENSIDIGCDGVLANMVYLHVVWI